MGLDINHGSDYIHLQTCEYTPTTNLERLWQVQAPLFGTERWLEKLAGRISYSIYSIHPEKNLTTGYVPIKVVHV